MSFFSGMTVANSQTTLIGKTGTFEAFSTVQLSDPTLGTYIDDGQIIVINAETGVPLTAGMTITDAPKIQLVQRSGATAASASLKYSGTIDGQAVYAFNGASYVAPQERIYCIGYNGASGAIDTTATSRFMNIGYKFDDVLWSQQQNRKVYFTSGTTQSGICDELIPLINYDSQNALMGGPSSSGFISAVMKTASAEVGVITGTFVNLVFTKGSNIVSADTLGTTITGVVAGDYIKVATGTTIAAYKVQSVTAATATVKAFITLTTPFQGATATVAAATTRYLLAATVAAAACGIYMTGLPLTFSLFPSLDVPLMKTDWDTFIPGWGTTTTTDVQPMLFGNGTYEQVAQYALMSGFFRGAQFQWDVPILAPTNDAVSGDTYSGIYIDHADISNMEVVSGVKPARRQEYIFLKVSAAQTALLLGVLNPWMNSTPRQFTAVGPLS